LIDGTTGSKIDCSPSSNTNVFSAAIQLTCKHAVTGAPVTLGPVRRLSVTGQSAGDAKSPCPSLYVASSTLGVIDDQ
jgi:hypothetical protein